MKSNQKLDFNAYARVALPHLQSIVAQNEPAMSRIAERLMGDVPAGRSLFVFGSGHSSLLPLELYHRAGGPSFVVPIVADYLLPTAGPSVVRMFERLPGSALPLLDRSEIKAGEMVWVMSQSGINAAGVELALQAKARGIFTVAFTGVPHSQSVDSRHASREKLFEVCDEIMDLGGVVGDAAVQVTSEIAVGPLSTLTAIFLAHSLLSSVIGALEKQGIRCAYTSVNTPMGESRNSALEQQASLRDPLLRSGSLPTERK